MNPNIRVIQRVHGRRMKVPVTLYDTALNSAAYGNTAVMGDLFGDIMGAVVGKDNWDARPQWMKDIVVKPDPAKLAAAAVKAVPPKLVGTVAGQAQKAGINLFYNTPAGQVPITPGMAEGAWSNFPAFARGSAMLGGIPTWALIAGGVGLVLMIFIAKK